MPVCRIFLTIIWIYFVKLMVYDIELLTPHHSFVFWIYDNANIYTIKYDETQKITSICYFTKTHLCARDEDPSFIHHWRCLPLLLAEILYGKKQKIYWFFSRKLRSQIENQVSDYRLLRPSNFCFKLLDCKYQHVLQVYSQPCPCGHLY